MDAWACCGVGVHRGPTLYDIQQRSLGKENEAIMFTKEKGSRQYITKTVVLRRHPTSALQHLLRDDVVAQEKKNCTGRRLADQWNHPSFKKEKKSFLHTSTNTAGGYIAGADNRGEHVAAEKK